MANSTYTVGNNTYEVNSNGTIVGGNNNAYGYQYSNSGSSSSPTTNSSSSSNLSAIIPTGSSSGSSSGSSIADQMAANSAAWAAANKIGNTAAMEAAHAANIALAGQTGQTFNSQTGVWSPNTSILPTAATTPTVTPQPQQQSMLQQVQEMINNFQSIQPTQPDYSNISAPSQRSAITADPSQTNFVNTKSYNDRVASQRQAADTLAYNTNQANSSAQMQLLGSLSSILPYYETTAAQKSALESSKAAAALEAQIQAQKDKQWQAEYELKQKELDADTNYKNASLDIAAAKNSGNGLGSLSAYQQYQIDHTQQTDDEKSQQWVMNEAASRAKSDPRLANGTTTQADGVNYFNYPDLVDAWRRQIIKDMYGGQ
jgi:hypothetical protein